MYLLQDFWLKQHTQGSEAITSTKMYGLQSSCE
uniref:Uncharacterized protein n=1 Tax=Anguilla anguilla TaxID=7936 RepID=A0A0E9QGQ6_ANGAN